MKLPKIAFGTLLLILTTLCSTHLSLADTSNTATTIATATVQPNGPRTGSFGTFYFNVQGGTTLFPSFGVIDFSISSFGVATTVSQINSLTLSLAESNTSTTRPASLNFYLTEDTTTSISNVAGAGYSPLRYQAASTPEGLGTQLSPNYLLGTAAFVSSGSVGTGTLDTYTFTLGGAAQVYLLSRLQTGEGNLRLIVTTTTTDGAATFAGSSNTTAATPRPSASLDVTFAASPNYTWIGGTGDWKPAGTSGDVNWNNGTGTFGPWDSTKTAVFGGTAGTVTLTGAVTAAGLQFDADGYTIAGGGNVLTLSAVNTRVAVTNATDTATISAEIAGTDGLTKTGLGKLQLSGINTYSGATTIQAGTLSVASDLNLGNATNDIALSGGTLQTTTVGFTTARNLTGTGGTIDANTSATFTGTVNTGTVTLLNAGTVTFSGASKTIGGLRFQQASTVVVTGGTPLNLSGTTFSNNTTGTAVIQGNIDLGSATATFNTADGSSDVDLRINGDVTSISGRLAKSGLGTLELTGNNSGLGGGASINAGRLLVHDGNALGTATAIFFNGGTLETQNTSGTTTFASGVSFGAGALATPSTSTFQGTNTEFSGASSFFKNGGNAQAPYQHSITVNNTKVTLTGDLTAATGTTTGFTVKGNGTFELAGNGQQFIGDGITIQVDPGATLLANRADAFGPATGIIGGRLGGSGSVSGLTLESTGVIAPGNSAGTLTAASLLWNGGGSMEFEIGSLSDLFVVSGALTKGSAGTFNFAFLNLGDVAVGQTITLVQFASTNFVAADFSSTGVGGNFIVGADNVSFTVNAIPEPQTYALLGLGFVGLLAFRRKLGHATH